MAAVEAAAAAAQEGQQPLMVEASMSSPRLRQLSIRSKLLYSAIQEVCLWCACVWGGGMVSCLPALTIERGDGAP
jgi:hypothetical protein